MIYHHTHACKLPAIGLLALSVMAGNQALAQNTKNSFALEEITVTARKVEENLQDVPVAVSAFTGDTLERRQITGTDDIGKITPNLQFTANAPLAGNNNSSVIFIRGVGQISPRANTDPGVGLYIDDVYMGQSVGGTMEMRDIAGVQVLRGPQGTLFGRNTIGGAVLINTTQPGEEFGGTIKAGVGEDSLFEFFGAVDIPFSDTVKSRFTLGSKKQDGYVKRLNDGTDLGDTNNWTATAKFLFEPTNDLAVRLAFDYTEADENGSPMVFAGVNANSDINNLLPPNDGWIAANASVAAGCTSAWVISAGGPPGRPLETAPGSTITLPNGGVTPNGGPPLGYVDATVDDPTCANDFQNAGPYANNGTKKLESSLENWGVSMHVEYDLNEAMTLKSVTSYRDLSWTGVRDADNTPLLILETDFESSGDQFSQELQLTYQGEGLTGVFGLFYYEEEIEDILTLGVSDRPSGFSCGVGTDRCHLDSDNNITENESWAIFTQWTKDFTTRLSGTFGIRYTEETKGSLPEQFDWIDSVNGDPDTVNRTPTADQLAANGVGYGDFYLEPKLYEADFQATTISANVSYDLSDTSMVYLSYSEGFKGGGWNSTFNFPISREDLAEGQQFDQEEVKTVELGFKSDITDNLRINGAIFSSDYTDLQFTYRVFIAPWFFNAGEASIDGAELELTWLPSENWIIEAGIGYLDATIDKQADISVGTQVISGGVEEGNKLPFAPELQGNLGIGYTVVIGDFTVMPRVDVTYSDEVYFDASNTEVIAQLDSYTTVDLSLAVETSDSRWRVVLGVNNLTDEEYRVSGNSSYTSGSGYAEVAYARPRMAFANLTYEF